MLSVKSQSEKERLSVSESVCVSGAVWERVWVSVGESVCVCESQRVRATV